DMPRYLAAAAGRSQRGGRFVTVVEFAEAMAVSFSILVMPLFCHNRGFILGATRRQKYPPKTCRTRQGDGVASAGKWTELARYGKPPAGTPLRHRQKVQPNQFFTFFSKNVEKPFFRASRAASCAKAFHPFEGSFCSKNETALVRGSSLASI